MSLQQDFNATPFMFTLETDEYTGPSAKVRFTYTPETVIVSNGEGRWDEVSLPYNFDAVEYRGAPARRLSFTGVFDNYFRFDPATGQQILASVATEVTSLERMGRPWATRNSPPPLIGIQNFGPWWARFTPRGIEPIGVDRYLKGWRLARLAQQEEDYLVDERVGLARVKYDIELAEVVKDDRFSLPAEIVQRELQKGRDASVYVVQQGDTLWYIANYFYGDGKRWTDIARKNGIRDVRNIRPGQTLKIPR